MQGVYFDIPCISFRQYCTRVNCTLTLVFSISYCLTFGVQFRARRVFSANFALCGVALDFFLIAFVYSLRAGETAGISVKTIDFPDRSLWITQEVQRVSDKALSELPKNEIIRIFPKLCPISKSSMILKGPKTEGSYRKQYLTTPS